MAKFGCYSLRLEVDLKGGDENKSKGEAYVELSKFPPPGLTAPINMDAVEITVWVYVPGGAIGELDKPNGMQIFVKDNHSVDNQSKPRSFYGLWFDLPGYNDKWVPIRMQVGRRELPKGYIDPGFDPNNVLVIGVKIGAGGGSKATYRGPIYVDAVNW